jgi:branched-chain amino acid transport system substrate-binding protein
MRRRTLSLVAVSALFAVLASGCSGSSSGARTIDIGAVYPISGSQGPGGIDEYRGVLLASEFANREGGVDGASIRLHRIDVPNADAAPRAIARLRRDGIRFVLGSYGSTISYPAADASARSGLLFWETGAVGAMSAEGRGKLVFRVAPSGLMLGRDAITFVTERLAPLLHRDPASLRFAVTYADDVYGSEVADGAVRAVRARGLPVVADIPYDPRHLSAPSIVRRLAAARPDVVFVSAYLADGVAIRRELVRQHVPLLVNVGTSSSFCMPAFGVRLGRDAVGAFASDKPAAEYINLRGLQPEARRLAREASDAYEERYDTEMSAAALAGFSAAWALFHDVMPRAERLTPTGVAAAAKGIRLPLGSLPNGSGLAFAPAGTSNAGWNVRAASVIWEWLGVEREAVVWPPRFATADVRLLHP